MSAPLKLRARARVPVKEVHRALTDAAALRIWLAEHAEVDLPHRYEFWGRYTPEGEAPHQRLLHADDQTLRLSWQLGGEETTVEITLAADGPEATVLALSQTHMPDWAEMIAGTNIRSVLATYWSLAIANLVDYLEGRPLTPKADFTSPQMRAEVLIDAPPDAVYDSMVDPEKFRQWFGVKIDIEPHVGGRWAMGGFEADQSPAKILELEPGHKMTMAWADGQTASWELAGSEGKTRLTFVQSGFDTGNPPYGAWLGWLSGVAELRRYHELSGWRPIWLGMEMPGMPEGMVATD
jgi:uncharacterized protein YndB with AHSA1/START domain